MKSFNIRLVLRGTVSETTHTCMQHDASRYDFPKSKNAFKCALICIDFVLCHAVARHTCLCSCVQLCALHSVLDAAGCNASRSTLLHSMPS